jgi:hypothetical protein
MSKTIQITENLPEEINENKLTNEIKAVFPTAEVEHKLPINWGNVPETETVTVKNLDDSVIDQDVINIVINHKPNGLIGVFHEACVGCWKCGGDHLYRTQRRRLIAYVQQNYTTMTSNELKEASEHFCTTHEVRDQFFTMDEQVDLGNIFNQRAIQDRQVRADKGISVLMNYLTYLESVTVINDLSKDELIDNYIKYGIEGTSEGDPEGLFDYFESTEGTAFEDNGFLEKTFIPRDSLTIAQLSAKIMDILRIAI